jgi:hypothetical protein
MRYCTTFGQGTFESHYRTVVVVLVVKMSKHVKARQKKKENENGVGNSIGNNKELYTIDYVLHEAVIPLFFLDIDDETS